MATKPAIEGIAEVLKLLDGLRDKGVRTVVRQAVRAGTTVVAKQMRKDLDAKARKARPAIRAKVTGRQRVRAKVGVHVGKKRERFPEPPKRKKPGKGIAGRNVHWWISGTRQRATKSGRNLGAMPAQQDGLAIRSYNATRQATFLAMRLRAEKALQNLIKRTNKRR